MNRVCQVAEERGGLRGAGVTVIGVISSCRVCRMVGCVLDAVEVLEQQAVRAGKGDEVGRCPRVRIVEGLVQAEPYIWCI